MSIRAFHSHHFTLFVEPSRLRQIADVLDRKQQRFDLHRDRIASDQKPSEDEALFLECLRCLTVHEGEISIHFRLPCEETDAMIAPLHDPSASKGATL